VPGPGEGQRVHLGNEGVIVDQQNACRRHITSCRMCCDAR
jgi:hypothetical protein